MRNNPLTRSEIPVLQHTCVSKFTACIAFLIHLDDVMRAFQKKRGLDIQDWYFSERMEINSAGEKDKKRMKRQNYVVQERVQ